ncbi:MAG: TIGR01906 family membrane protein [Chloroflexi bacterium]|nr:TIGR01906 family membrane protein [Chloroflexota bacterium]
MKGPFAKPAIFAATLAFAFALPILFISGNVRALVNSKQTYDYNWWSNDIEGRTGLPRQELDRAGRQFRDYFNSGDEYLDLAVEVGGRQERILKEREVIHMKDVKALVRRVFAAEWIAGGIVLAFIAGGFAGWRTRFWPVLRGGVSYSALGTIVAVAVTGLAAAIDFDTAFTIFHEISFNNDYWLLNPYRDYLILMFPEAFFFEATIALAVMTALEFAVIFTGVRWFEKRFAAAGVSATKKDSG